MRDFFLSLALAVTLVGCGDDDRTGDDAERDGGASADGGMTSADAGEGADGGSEGDAGGAVDGGDELDAGETADDGGSTSGCTIGSACSGSCPDGYECQGGRCLPPSARPGCGGFAAATCDTAEYPSCLYYSGTDYGACLTPEEAACACAEHADLFSCL